MERSTTSPITTYLTIFAGVFALGAIGYLTYHTVTLKEEVAQLTYDLSVAIGEHEVLYASTTKKIAQDHNTIEVLSSELSLTAEELDELEDDYRAEKKKNKSLVRSVT